MKNEDESFACHSVLHAGRRRRQRRRGWRSAAPRSLSEQQPAAARRGPAQFTRKGKTLCVDWNTGGCSKRGECLKNPPSSTSATIGLPTGQHAAARPTAGLRITERDRGPCGWGRSPALIGGAQQSRAVRAGCVARCSAKERG